MALPFRGQGHARRATVGIDVYGVIPTTNTKSLSATQGQAASVGHIVLKASEPPLPVTPGHQRSRRRGSSSGFLPVYGTIPPVAAANPTLTATQGQAASVAVVKKPGVPTLTAAQGQAVNVNLLVRQAGPLGFKTYDSFPTISVAPLKFSGASQDGDILPREGLEQTVIWDGAQFRMYYHGWENTADKTSGGWATNGAPVRQATSTDGVSWSASTIAVDRPAVGQGWASPFVQQIGGTYHMLVRNTGVSPECFDYYTSSDGSTWTLAKHAVLGHGSPDGNFQYLTAASGQTDTAYTSAQWDAYGLGNVCFTYDATRPAGQQFIVYYDGINPPNASGSSWGTWRVGIATGPDLQHLTKYAGNPVMDLAPGVRTGKIVGGTEVHAVDGVFYAFAHESDPGTSTFLTPTSLSLWKSTDGFAWSRVTYLHRLYDAASRADGQGQQIADPSVVEVNGVTHLYWEQLNLQSDLPDICHASYPGTLSGFISQILGSPVSNAAPTVTSTVNSTNQVVLTTNTGTASVLPIMMDGTPATKLTSDPGSTQAARTYYLSGTTLKLGTSGVTHVDLSSNAVNLNTSQGQAASLRMVVTKVVHPSQSSAATVSSSVTASGPLTYTRALSASTATAVSLVKVMSRVFQGAQPSSAILAGPLNTPKAISVSSVSVPSLARQAQPVLAPFSRAKPSLGVAVSRTSVLTVATSAGVTTAKTKPFALAATQGQSASVSTSKTLTGSLLPIHADDRRGAKPADNKKAGKAR